MNELDTLYRAFADYKRLTAASRDCTQNKRAVMSASTDSESLDVFHAIVSVDEDWIEAIEAGLIHVEKAIAEERQFIRSEGEVVPIERVRRVSKESVRHLAKHSDLITREPDEDDLTPDKLYMVERINDYAVYENRFLYMLLQYLKSFIGYRYEQITAAVTTYHGELSIDKTVTASRRKTVFTLKMTDEKKNDSYLREHHPLKDTVARIESCQRMVAYFIATPLMQEVAKVAVLKPPITKTNVLKMNRNFKGAVALYDFIMAYDRAGFTVEQKRERVKPFSDELADEFAEVVLLTEFITYKRGLRLNKFLAAAFETEEARLKAEEERKLAERCRQLKRRIEEQGIDPAEYMLLLERRVKAAEPLEGQLAAAAAQIESLGEGMEALRGSIQQLNDTVAERDAAMAAARLAHEAEIAAITERHEAETERLQSAFESELAAKREAHEAQLTRLNEAHGTQIKELAGRRAEAERLRQADNERHEARYRECAAEAERARAAEAELAARFTALRVSAGRIGPNEDFTARESFDELERQFDAFKAFFMTEWRKTKRRIRREVLRTKHTEPDTAEPDIAEQERTEPEKEENETK